MIGTMERPDAPGGTALLAGRPVARIGFGAMQLPGPRVWGPPRDRDTALAVLRRAVELGVNHIDTAQFYGPGVANELIQAGLHPYPAGLVLVSKVGGARDAQGGWLPAQRPEQLRAGVEANLRSLAVERDRAQTEALLADLDAFGMNLKRIADAQDDTGKTVGWAPEIDDGVLINLAPLHTIVPSWALEPRKCWERLLKGDCDWSHTAMRYWPTRVRQKCRTNASHAIAHGL